MNEQDREYLIKQAKLIHESDLLEDGILSKLAIAFVMGETHQMNEEIKRTEQRILDIKHKHQYLR